MFFIDILRNALPVLLPLLTVPRSLRRCDPNDYVVMGTLAFSDILTDNEQHFLPCGITLKLMEVIKEQAISHWEWSDENSACVALFLLCWFLPQFTMC